MNREQPPAPSEAPEEPAAQAPEEPEERPGLTGSPGEDDAAPSTISEIAVGSVHGGPTLIGCQHVVIDVLTTSEERDGHREHVPLHAFDLTDDLAHTRSTFVTPEFYDDLVRTLRAHRLAVLHGAGSGRGTAAAVALSDAEHTPVLLLPLDVSPDTLVRAVERICHSTESPMAGIVVENIERVKLATLLGPLRRRLTAALGKHGTLVFTANVPAPERARLPVELQVACSPPKGAAVADRLLGEKDSAIAPAVREAVQLLGDPVAPETVSALVKTARRSGDTADRLAAQFASRATDALLREWFTTPRTPRELAALTAAAVLHGMAAADVDAQAVELCARLDPGLARLTAGDEEHAGRVFGLADRGWPEGFAQTARREIRVHFGLREVEVIELCPPHTPERVLRFLWTEVDAAFRPVLTGWIRELPSGSGRLRVGAAAAAGILFAIEPTVAEQQILRPWVLDGRVRQRSCAADAVGIAIFSSGDPVGARTLVQHWGRASDLRLRQAAVMAYGGLLGAWDQGADAASHLWRIGEQTPELAPWADMALAELVAAGGDAGRVRATVVAVLHVRSGEWDTRRRAFALLPLIVERLTSGRPDARASLQALLAPAEYDTLLAFGAVLSRALRAVEPGREHARSALLRMLDAEGVGRAPEGTAANMIRAMRAATTDADARTRLRLRIERILASEARRKTRRAELANALLLMFFPSHQTRRQEAS